MKLSLPSMNSEGEVCLFSLGRAQNGPGSEYRAKRSLEQHSVYSYICIYKYVFVRNTTPILRN